MQGIAWRWQSIDGTMIKAAQNKPPEFCVPQPAPSGCCASDGGSCSGLWNSGLGRRVHLSM
jgi:hypothetical protein